MYIYIHLLGRVKAGDEKEYIKHNDKESYVILTTCAMLAKLRLKIYKEHRCWNTHKIDNSANVPQAACL